MICNNKPENMKNFLKSTPFLTNGLSTIGWILTLVGIAISEQLFSSETAGLFRALFVGFLSFPLIIIGVVFIIIRREYPRIGQKSICGFPAVLIGYIYLLFFSFAELCILYLGYSHFIILWPK